MNRIKRDPHFRPDTADRVNAFNDAWESFGYPFGTKIYEAIRRRVVNEEIFAMDNYSFYQRLRQIEDALKSNDKFHNGANEPPSYPSDYDFEG